MSSEACVHCALPSSITSALDPTRSTSQLVTIEIFSPALCFSAHTNNYFYFLHSVSTLTFCINVLPRLIVNGCVLSPRFENKRRYNNTIIIPIPLYDKNYALHKIVAHAPSLAHLFSTARAILFHLVFPNEKA